jgi:hypothetical protein
MASSGKTKHFDSKKLNIEYYEQISWTLDEYKEAVKNSDFFGIVKPYLDADLEPGDDPEKRVVSKFYYAGGCARSMFQILTDEVKEMIITSIHHLPNISDLIYGNVGGYSANTSHNLMTVYANRKRSLLSAFCAIAIASIRGPSFIRDLAKNPLFEGNPFINGGFFELYFFAYAATGRIPFITQRGVNSFWKCAETVSVFKPKSPTKVSCGNDQWLKPNVWSQPGYDAVYLYERIEDQKKVIRFVQITRRHAHEVKLSYFRELIDEMEKTKVFVAEQVEVFFVVPTEILDSYKVGKIENPDCFADKFGWPKIEEEVRCKISIVGLEF